jgi:hypothetical protein
VTFLRSTRPQVTVVVAPALQVNCPTSESAARVIGW